MMKLINIFMPAKCKYKNLRISEYWSTNVFSFRSVRFLCIFMRLLSEWHISICKSSLIYDQWEQIALYVYRMVTYRQSKKVFFYMDSTSWTPSTGSVLRIEYCGSTLMENLYLFFSATAPLKISSGVPVNVAKYYGPRGT